MSRRSLLARLAPKPRDVAAAAASDAVRCFVESVPIQRPRSALGDQLVTDAFQPIWDGDDIELSYTIRNRDRTVGAALSGALALEFGEKAGLDSFGLFARGDVLELGQQCLRRLPVVVEHGRTH